MLPRFSKILIGFSLVFLILVSVVTGGTPAGSASAEAAGTNANTVPGANAFSTTSSIKDIGRIRGVANQNHNGFPSIDSGLIAPSSCPSVKLLIPIYKQAGASFDVPWNVLAGINKIETDMGCNLSVSSAGAEGWMQFMPGTWKSYGMDADGDGKADPMNAVDAIFSAARYLDASGASHDLHGAILSYNHAEWYVQQVLQAAQEFQGISGAESADLTKVEKKLFALQQRMNQAKTQVDNARGELKQLTERLRRFHVNYEKVNKKLIVSRNHLAKVEGGSSALIKQYADIAYYSNIGQNSSENNQELLSYIGNSNTPQEAMTTYTTAKVLLENRQALLEQIQGVASTVRSERNLLADTTAIRKALILQEKLDIHNKKQAIVALKVAKQVIKKEYKSIAKKQGFGNMSLNALLGSGFNTTVMDGHPVANWIHDILQEARSDSVEFTVTSGFRTDAEQLAIWNSGVRPAAKPKSLGGQGSRHEGAEYPLGAVDIYPGAGELNAWLVKSRWRNKLFYAGSKDNVHFSHPSSTGY